MADLLTVGISAAIASASGGIGGVLFVNAQLTKLATQMAAVLERMEGADEDNHLSIANRASTEARLAAAERAVGKIDKLNDDTIRLGVKMDTLEEGQRNVTRNLEGVQRQLGGLTRILQEKGALFRGIEPGE
jgi:chaperonin cofactor prefoldin